MAQQRKTRQRKMVLEAVRARKDHPNAHQIYKDVREKDCKIGLGTVYRNLRVLADNREIIQISVPHADRFDYRADPHYHLQCAHCGAVSDIDIPYFTELDERAAKETGYIISGHNTVFEGLCPDCRKSTKRD